MNADLSSRFAVFCINSYQKHLSPRKGWNCAHRVLHGGESCSAFVKRAILEKGWHASIALARERFAECKNASADLHVAMMSAGKNNSNARAKRRQRHSRKNSKSDWCDCSPAHCDLPFCGRTNKNNSGLADAIFDTGPGDSGCIDCDVCDCNLFP